MASAAGDSEHSPRLTMPIGGDNWVDQRLLCQSIGVDHVDEAGHRCDAKADGIAPRVARWSTSNAVWNPTPLEGDCLETGARWVTVRLREQMRRAKHTHRWCFGRVVVGLLSTLMWTLVARRWYCCIAGGCCWVRRWVCCMLWRLCCGGGCWRRRGLSVGTVVGSWVISKKFGAGSTLRRNCSKEPRSSRAHGGRRRSAIQSGRRTNASRRRSSLNCSRRWRSVPDRGTATRYDRVLRSVVERERARFGAWYEMFPRSAGTDPDAQRARSTRPRRGCPTSRRWASTCCTCRRSIRSAAASARARTTRSTPGPDDPGSPWAIGGDAGGHTRRRAGPRHDRGLRSVRRGGRGATGSRSRSTSPTRRRPTIPTCASIRSGSGTGPTARSSTPRTRRRNTRTSTRSTSSRSDWQALWQRAEARHRVLDRPRREDLPRRQPAHQAVPVLGVGARARSSGSIPDTIFLSEAFTRPKVMRYLAKSGFSQSYTYFTWRNTKDGADRVLHRAHADRRARVHAAEPVRQHAGHPARVPAARRPAGVPGPAGPRRDARRHLRHLQRLRAVRRTCRSSRAARNTSTRRSTRSGCATSIEPDSLAELIGRINAIRRDHPALQRDWGLRFHADRQPAAHLLQQAIARTARDLVLVVVNLDPHHMQHGFVQLPLRTGG